MTGLKIQSCSIVDEGDVAGIVALVVDVVEVAAAGQ